MINLQDQTITLNKTYPIKDYVVWWYVEGVGLCHDLEQALISANGRSVQAVTVATTIHDDIYEVLN